MRDSKFANIVKSIKKLYHRYSVEDIATALFVSSLWLPNIASPVKHVLFAAVFCSMKPEEFAETSTIKVYSDCRRFLIRLYKIAPNFMLLEDYVPELDWGEVKFSLHGKKYQIFYAGDLSNAYDHLTLFQILYNPLNEKFMKLVQRSPLDELDRVLALQDSIITSISSQPARDGLDVSPGDTSIPSESFWRDAVRTYESLNLGKLAGDVLLREFSIKLGDLSPDVLTMEKVGEAVIDGLTFPVMFIECKGRHYLILPRRMSGILFDAWGELLKRYQDSLSEDGRPLEVEIAGEFCRFVKERFSKEDAFFFVSARLGDREAHDVIFPVAIKSKEKLVLFYILPPAINEEITARKLAEIIPRLKEAVKLLQKPPTQLVIHLRNQLVEFRSDHPEKAMTPIIFIIIPQTYTRPFSVKVEEELPGRVEFMDSVLAILDEIYNIEHFSDLIDYLEVIEKYFIPPLISLLDKFASFKDTHGVLIDGASTPNMVMIDPNWGSQYRYESLAKFWRLYPEKDFFGHPRSWQIHEMSPQRIQLVARSFFALVFHCKIGKAHVFVTAPFDKMTFTQGEITNFLVECAEDNLYQYRDAIKDHQIFEKYQELIVQIFPRSLVTSSSDFKHLMHLVPEKKLWCADTGFPDSHSIGVRIVFNEETVRESFLNVQDRSMETALLLEIINQIDSLYHDPEIQKIIEIIESGKTGRPRRKFFIEKKPASFPELVRPCLPSSYDFKLAKKRLAELAKQAGVFEGSYDLIAAKDRLNVLRKMMVAEINLIVSGFSFSSSISQLIGWADAVTNRRERDRMTIEHSLSHDVDYNRDEQYSENERKFSREHRNYRYLIEKFVQLQPTGMEAISEAQTRRLLALIDWFFVIIDASDIIHYEISPVGLKINHDFLIEIEYDDEMTTRQLQFAQEQAKLRLGLIGNSEDALKPPKPVKEQINALDNAFYKDYKFRLTNLLEILSILTHWPVYQESVAEACSYSATRDEIVSVTQKIIKSLSASEIDFILDFLTLKSEELLRIHKDETPCDDLPVWEHKRRLMRYTIRPLIKLGQRYIWGPYAARTARIIWSGSPFSGTLPVDIGKANINRLLQEWKKLLDRAVETRTSDIIKRFTPYVISNARLHNLDKNGGHLEDLGDYDVLAYCPSVHIVLNVECKNLLPVFCLKDAKDLRETIFGIPGKKEGHFRQINKRQKYLVDNYLTIAKVLNWPLSLIESPKILSLYVTPMAYWWTRFPPRPVDTTFVQIEMLSEFIKDLGVEEL